MKHESYLPLDRLLLWNGSVVLKMILRGRGEGGERMGGRDIGVIYGVVTGVSVVRW